MFLGKDRMVEWSLDFKNVLVISSQVYCSCAASCWMHSRRVVTFLWKGQWSFYCVIQKVLNDSNMVGTQSIQT